MKTYIFEWVIGATIVITGAVVSSIAAMMPPAAPFHGALLAVGSVATTLGGVLISWFVSKALTLSAAKQEYHQQLDSLSRNLGQAAGQITRVVERAELRELHPASAFALVSQAAGTIYGQVNEIAVLRGSQFDAAYLIETAKKLNNLASELEGSGKSPERLEDVRRELSSVTDKLASRVSGSRSFSLVRVPCPYCHSINSVEVGDFPGDTSTPTCTECNTRFNIHRSSAGTPFTRKVLHGIASTPPAVDIAPDAARWSFKCPTCNSERTIALIPGSSIRRNIVCTECLTELTLDTVAHTIQQGQKCKRLAGKIEGRSGARPVMACPECGTKVVALMNDGAAYMAFCRKDHVVYSVSHTEFEEWRRANSQVPSRMKDPAHEASVVVAAQPGVAPDGRSPAAPARR